MQPVDTAGTPTSWVLPRMPDDDIAAWRQLAAAHRQLAAELRDAAAAARVATAGLPAAWSGSGERASAHPLSVLQSDFDVVCRALDESAGLLDAKATELQRAHDAHAWTLKKILKVGAVVVISGAAVYVTAGLAAPEVASADAAVLGTETIAAEGSVATASVARTGLTVAAQGSSRLFAAVRGLGAVVRPQLPWATAFTGAEATRQMSETGTLDPKELATTFGIALTMPGAMAGARSLVREVPLMVSRPAAAAVTSHLAAGTVTAGFDGTRQQIVNGRVDAGHVVHAGVTGATFSAAGDLMERVPLAWRPGAAPAIAPRSRIGATATGIPRQSLDAALNDGVDLPAHEGDFLGHTLDRHVGWDWSYLQARLDNEGGAMKSAFTDEETASRAITETLLAHRTQVSAFENGQLPDLPPLSMSFSTPLGKVLLADGTRLQGSSCRVLLRRDGGGGFVLTSYVMP